jgi:beta-1,2-mannobiose phosphorylase / 1,2-beta-oligomannan phosphorylase
MSPQEGEAHEAWGVLNPAGVRAADGTMHLFPRLVNKDNVSRIGHARVRYYGTTPTGVERLGIALEPDEVGGGGGFEDPRVVYIPLLKRYVMTYTAFVPIGPRIAIAISADLQTWRPLGIVRYEVISGGIDLNRSSNKDAAFFPDVVLDPQGIPSLGILHRPTTRANDYHGFDTIGFPHREETLEHIWISYVPVEAVLADITSLTSVRLHQPVMAPEQPWERSKVGTGAPPVRLPYGWVLPYHAVSTSEGHPRYCMGIAILDLECPSRVLFRTLSPILEPLTDYERNDRGSAVIFPTATDLGADGLLDTFYGAADRVIAVARITLPSELPTTVAAIT